MRGLGPDDSLYRVWSDRAGRFHVDVHEAGGRHHEGVVDAGAEGRPVSASRQALLLAEAILKEALDRTPESPDATAPSNAAGLAPAFAKLLLDKFSDPEPWIIWRSDVYRWLDHRPRLHESGAGHHARGRRQPQG